MLTARETTRPIVTREISDCSPMMRLGGEAQRHRVGRAEGGRVGQRHVQVVDEHAAASPGTSGRRSSAGTGSQACRRGRRRACRDRRDPTSQYQSAKISTLVSQMSEPEMISCAAVARRLWCRRKWIEQRERDRVGEADERCDRERDPPARNVLGLDEALRGDDDQARPTSGPRAPAGSTSVRCTSRGGRSSCRAIASEHGQQWREARFAARRRRVCTLSYVLPRGFRQSAPQPKIYEADRAERSGERGPPPILARSPEGAARAGDGDLRR